MIRFVNKCVTSLVSWKINYSFYIHLRDHDKKINPQKNKLAISYMNTTRQEPKAPFYKSRLRQKAQANLQQRLFKQYTKKVIEGVVDQEQEKQIDPLWGENPVPLHYYRNLTPQQATHMAHSDYLDAKPHQLQIVTPFFKSAITVTNLDEVKDVNDLAGLAVHYRLTNQNQYSKWHEIQKGLTNKYYKLSNKSLIALKYAFTQVPKFGSPTFHQILNDLLLEDVQNLTKEELIHLLYANRLVKFSKTNIHKTIFQNLDKYYSSMSFEEKIDFLFIYVDCRLPFLSKPSFKKFRNQERQKFNQLIYKLNLSELNFNSTMQCRKFTYALARSKVIHTDYYSKQILAYCVGEKDNLSVDDCLFFLRYLPKLEGGKGVFDDSLFEHFKQVIVGEWNNLEKLEQMRSLYHFWQFGKYDQQLHQLYSNIEIQADDLMLAYFCELEMSNSSSREWQILHVITQLSIIPTQYYQSYKRFYNYMANSTDWNLKPIKEKLQNTQPFVDLVRNREKNYDKPIIKGICNYIEFVKLNPPMFLNMAIKNTEFVDFHFGQYQISLDIINEKQLIPGTEELRQSYKNKIKSLEILGWKHLYILEKEINENSINQILEYIESAPTQFIEEQKEVIKAAEEYRAYELEQLRNENFWKTKTIEETELWINDPEEAAKLKDKKQPQDPMMMDNI